MASTFKIYQGGEAKTISFRLDLSAPNFVFQPMYQPEDVEVEINGSIALVTISNITSDNVSKDIPIFMTASLNSEWYGDLSVTLIDGSIIQKSNFSYWSDCVIGDDAQTVTASLPCIYNLDRQNGNYNDYCQFLFEVEGIMVNIAVNFEHEKLY